ncbi:DUF4265 domain-containing protein [Intrasporangium sp.]|uniref:DUF4265 domain-containing protein n=1 Tax=Intrasporangium sp. TaxID=1925024 RepID=UPI0033657085
MSVEDEAVVKLRFQLVPDAERPEPVESEGLWAFDLGDGTYRLANVPWFVTGVALDDVVEAAPSADGTLWAIRSLRWSGRHVVRLSPIINGDPMPLLERIEAGFEQLDVGIESIGPPEWLTALDIPADADLAAIKNLLREGAATQRWTFEEACVGARWDAL